MKRIILHIIIGCFLLGWATSCEKELPLYDYPDDMLNFDLTISSETKRPEETNYSFVYVNNTIEVDTVWVTVKTMGFLSEQDRPFELEQISSGKKDAQPGVHYVSFDDAELKQKFYYIPANKVEAKIPVVVKKDASLAEEDVALYFTFKDNGFFRPGYSQYSVMYLNISNRLSKPVSWNYIMDYYYGTYSTVRHKFMIDATGYKWDDAFIEQVLADYGLTQYMGQLLVKKLKEENARRAEQGLGVLCEDEEGLNPITFSTWDY